ncbi:hypothetical protein LPTSP4_20720 [Leptospira ryugenii]|uniref:Uncharacterized protein n=1 Tax=Leptospira ryugenii TaxID=1917863 RepID=A0A2P2E172_9LEPT|nr:hypothetical protein LPTSP4_20720 [Leptospira ryugenii]
MEAIPFTIANPGSKNLGEIKDSPRRMRWNNTPLFAQKAIKIPTKAKMSIAGKTDCTFFRKEWTTKCNDLPIFGLTRIKTNPVENSAR